MGKPGTIFELSSMNDFPMPEDPPVMMTAEMFLSISSEGDMDVEGVTIFEPAPIVGLAKPKKAVT